MLSMTNSILLDVVKDHEDIFDLFICQDSTSLKDVVYFKETHPQLPLIRIYDPAKRVPIEKIKATKSLFDSKGLVADNGAVVSAGDYAFMQDVMFMPHHHEPKKFKDQIEQFLDGTNKQGDPLQHHYQTERFKPNVLSRKVCAADFERVVLEDKSFD